MSRGEKTEKQKAHAQPTILIISLKFLQLKFIFFLFPMIKNNKYVSFQQERGKKKQRVKARIGKKKNTQEIKKMLKEHVPYLSK